MLLLAAGADLTLKAGRGTPADHARAECHIKLADYLQSIMDDPVKRPTPESAGLDMDKRIAALKALGKPLGSFTQMVLMRKARETQRQEALHGRRI